MGDTFVATVYATVDGVEVSASLEYSMAKYIDSQLKKEIKPELRTALSDLVVYGEASQIYGGYKTDALLRSKLEYADTMTPSTFSELDSTYNKQTSSGTSDANVDIKTVGMTLGSKVFVNFTVLCKDTSAYSMKVVVGEGDQSKEYTYTFDGLELAAGYTDRYVLNFDQLKSTQFGDLITLSFYDADGNQVSRTFTYSVYTYVYKNQTKNDAKLVDLLKALYNYGEAVKSM